MRRAIVEPLGGVDLCRGPTCGTIAGGVGPETEPGEPKQSLLLQCVAQMFVDDCGDAHWPFTFVP